MPADFNSSKLPFQAVIFDFDGTLFDSLDLWGEVSASVLKQYGIVQDDALSEILDKLTLEGGIAYCIETFKIPASPETVYEQFQTGLLEGYSSRILPKPGVKQILETCCKKNLPAVIVSSSIRTWIEKALQNHDLDMYFRKIYSCSEWNTDKSVPDIFLAAAADLNLPPENILVVEDSLFALKTARKAGFVTAGVYEEHERNPKEMKKLADVFWNSLIEGSLFLEKAVSDPESDV